MTYNVSIKWNIFAISHAKGVVDGIGGTVKRTVCGHFRTERRLVSTPREYASLAQQLCPRIRVEFITLKNGIDQQSSFLDAR